MEKLLHRVARKESIFIGRLRGLLNFPWFIRLEVAGSNAYGTALQGGSDLDLQVNCYFELSTISAGSPIIPLNSLNSPDMEQCVRA